MINLVLFCILAVALLTLLSSCLNRQRLTAMCRDLKIHRSDLSTNETERAAGIKEGRDLSISERHDRVLEAERVEDRAEKKARDSI